MTKRYVGVIPPVVTPVDEHENVDEAGFRKLISHCIVNGIHGIFVAGSNGECLALTQEQRDRAIRIAIDETAGRVPVMAGTMDSSTRRVIENTKRLEQMGGTCAVITPVFYARHATQDETVRHFEAIARATSIDLMIYNIPPFTGQLLKPETIFTIAKIDRVVGYKDTSGQFPDFLRCLAHFKGTDFCLHQGATNLAVPSMLLGADGYIPSLAPLFPIPHLKVCDYGRAGDIAKTVFWGEILHQACTLYGMSKSQTSSTKYALSKLGFFDKRAILPTEPILAAEEAMIDKRIAEVEAMIRNAA